MTNLKRRLKRKRRRMKLNLNPPPKIMLLSGLSAQVGDHIYLNSIGAIGIGNLNKKENRSPIKLTYFFLAFRKEQERLKIPTDPAQWNLTHVQHWLRWAVTTFKTASIQLKDWSSITGMQLCDLSHSDFKKKVSVDPGDLFWTHLELLKKCQFVAVVQKGPTTLQERKYSVGSKGTTIGAKKKKPVTLGVAKENRIAPIPDGCPGNRSGNNGQIQLWQFLLELLTDKEHREVIQWNGNEGEFKLSNPEVVAQLWGARKNKPNMNYEKLSRALRYYYDGDMISKVKIV